MDQLILALDAGPGWQALLDPSLYLKHGFTLVAATAAGAALAYHPVYRGRPASMEMVELRKALIIYAAVGALIAIICTVSPSMAFVIFGIGGLMRFRTDLGASKTTGHAIMATLVGLCFGLGLQAVAVLATVYFWIAIFVLERTRTLELSVGGVAVSDMGPSAEAYRKAFTETNVQVLSHAKNFKKGFMTFVLKVPRAGALEAVVAAVQRIPADLRGTPDWPE